MEVLKKSMSDKLTDLLAFWKLHTASMVHSSTPNMSFSVESLDPARVRFYLQVLSNLDKYNQVLKEYDLSSVTRNTWDEAIKDFNSYGTYLNTFDPKDVEKAKADINAKLKGNPMTSRIKVSGGDGEGVTGTPPADILASKSLLDSVHPSGAGDSFYREQLKKTVHEDPTGNNHSDVVKRVTNHPFFGPKEKNTTNFDIIVFIALTYMIRAISLFIVDWAINSSMVSSLEEAFFLYTGLYIILFGCCCLLVNTGSGGGDDDGDGSDDDEFLNPFKLLFYYLNLDVNSSTRIYVHIVLQLILFPVMLFVRDRSIKPEDSYEMRRSILRVLSTITMFIWIITSVVSFRL